MSSNRKLIWIGVVLVAWLGAATRTRNSETRSAKPGELVQQQAAQLFAGLPLVFEPNLGQTNPEVHFFTRAAGMKSYLTDRGNVMVLSRRRDAPDPRDAHETPELEQAVVRMNLEGSRAPQHFEGHEKVESISNYFIGNVPSKWVTNVPNYRKVRASGVYSGIDLVYYGDGRKLEYDFVVRPGGNPKSIRLAYEGADSLTIDQKGNLLIATGLGTLVQRKPLVYQEINGERREVQASYSIRAGKVEFALANWDRRRALVIDPVLEYSTYLGGTGTEQGNAIALDASGMAYVTGFTSGDNFPVTAGQTTFGGGSFDAFVTKLNPSAAALVYTTYLGGTGSDYGYGIAVNASGEAYVTGATASTDFPPVGAFQATLGGVQDAFVTKLNEAGSALLFSTYLGGADTDQGNGIALDASGEAYVTGYTLSANFPTMGAFQTTYRGSRDAFVTKLNASGSALVFSTYLGGGLTDQGNGIAVDSSGAAYVIGVTNSTDFPTLAALQATYRGGLNDAFVTKLDASGSMLYSTYLGGTGDDQGRGIAIDNSGAPYVTGQTTSTDFPTTLGAFQPTYGPGPDAAFVTKLNALGFASLSYSTYLGPTQDGIYTQGIGIAVNASGEAYVTGLTNATNFPTTSKAPQTSLGGSYDVFVTKLNASGSTPEFSTYLGGLSTDQGLGIALDSSGAAYVTGFTDSLNFPVTSGAYQATVGGSSDAFVTKLNIPTLGLPAKIMVAGGGTQGAIVGFPFGTSLQAMVTDADGNGLPGVTVTFAAPGSGASATLSATSVTTNVSGIASVTATANTTVGSYVVTASVAGVTATFNLTNIAGQVETITFVQQPANTQAGQTISPAVTVRLTDTHNNPIANMSVTMSLVEAGAMLGGTLTETSNASGIAMFANLDITKAGTYHLVAAAGGVTMVSSPFNISAASSSAVISVYSGDMQSAPVGLPYPAPLQAQVQDPFGNVLSGVAVTFTPPGSGASVTFSGSATVNTDNNGIAPSPAMTANAQLGTFQVTATAAGASSPALFNLTNLADTANPLSFVGQPTDTIAGQHITPPVTVQLKDSLGNAVHSPGVPITVQANGVLQQKGLFSGTLIEPTDANGVATFSDLSIALAGTYQLQATSPGVASATSNPFHVTTGAASSITATGGAQQSTFVLTAFSAPLQVAVTDAAGNPVAGVPVVFAAPNSGPSGTFGAQPMVTANTDAQGHAQAVITANNIAGSYAVTATATLVTGSASFALTNLPPSSTMLRFVQQPSSTQAGQVIAPPVTVQIETSSGGASNTAGVPIVLSLASGTGTLLGTVVQLTDPTGTATFNDLRISAVGPKQLTATSPSRPPVASSTFQISAGAPASITAVSGSTPQSTTVLAPFPSRLQAQVLDTAGNPVPGVSVTFTAPASGPGATFAATPTVVTDNSGIATAPLLTANGTAGSFAVTASAAGVSGQAAFSLTNLPPSGSLKVSPSTLTINQGTPPGQTVQVSSTGAALSWTASPSAPWIMVSPSTGTTPATATISVNPAGLAAGNYSGSIVFSSPSGGTTAVLVSYAIAAKPALVVTSPELVFTTSSVTVTPPPQTLTTTSSGGPISYGVTAQVATPTGGSWLKVSTSSGQTGGSVQVSVDLTGLSQGFYNGSVSFTPTDSTINSVSVPVALQVACGQGGCTGFPATILAVVNGASFHPAGAPGAAMTIFGTNLADAVYQATTYPLPTQLGPTSVTVNGNPVPLYFASPTQINFQMPFGAPVGGVQVAVTNGSTRVQRAQAFNLNLTAEAPGLFISPGNRAAALNQDFSANTPSNPVGAGGYILLFMTGHGPLSPPLSEGEAAPTTPLSSMTGTVQVSIGGQPATVSYAGVAPGFAGLGQINAIVPAGLVAGDQPVFVTVNGVASNAGLITVK